MATINGKRICITGIEEICNKRDIEALPLIIERIKVDMLGDGYNMDSVIAYITHVATKGLA